MVCASSRLLLWGLAVCSAAVWDTDASWAGPPNQYLDCVTTFYDNVLRYGRDEYGKKTPLFVDGIQVSTKTPVVAANGDMICDFVFQQYLLRGLVGLSAVTGEQKYRRAACDATDYVLKNLVNAKSGLIYWGPHVYWDLKTDGPRFDPHNSHELKYDYPYYELLYEVNPQATTRFIESYWNAHVDLADPWLMFGRHARMERPGPRGKVKPGELAFTLSAADLFYAAGFLFAKTNDPVWRDRAVGLAERFARLRDPKTGLGPAVLDAHDPTFDRKTHQLSLGHLGVTVRNLLIDYGRRSDSYALGQLYLAQTLPPEPAHRFREWALQDLLAYSQYCYDETSRAFYEMRRTDTAERIAFSQMRVFPTLAAGHYFSYPMRFQGNKGLALLFLAYARGYKLTHDKRLMGTVEKCLDILDIARGKPATLAGVPDDSLKSDSAACLIQGLLDLHEAETDGWYLQAARGLADDALGRFYGGGFFVDWPDGFPASRVDQSLPLALLRLHAVLNGSRVALPQEIGGYGMSATHPNDITGLDGDLSVRFLWSKHYVDIGDGNLSARVGDFFPHDRRASGVFNYPGIWQLSSPHFSGNLLDGTKGMVFEPLWRVMPWGVRKLSDRNARIEHWQFESGPVKRPYLGIRMDYGVPTADCLDWALEVTPLEEGYGDLALRAKAHLNAKATPQLSFFGPAGLSSLEVPEGKEVLVRSRDGVAQTPDKYQHPLFCSRLENALLAFMFKPGTPIDILAAGPSPDSPGGLRGFVWHIADAKKDEAYRLHVRLEILPASRAGELMSHYERWCAGTREENATGGNVSRSETTTPGVGHRPH